jgi:TRAP-type mannitol/chloroaromatic compound transport system substrate-binding protein
MNKRILIMTLVMLLTLSLVATGCPPVEVVPEVPVPEPAVVHRWDIQTVMGAGWPTFPTFVRFAENVKAMTGGRIVITPHADGAVVGPFDKFDAVRGGVLDGMHSSSKWWVGKDPAFGPGVGLVAGFPEDWMLEAWYWDRGGLELMREVYARFGFHLVGPITFGPESIHFTRPVRTLEDLRGLLFRAGPGMPTELYGGRLGAATISLPGGELYLALEKGTIEGTEFLNMSIMYALGIHEVAPYFVVGGFHAPSQTINFSVAMENWNALTPDLQAILETAVRAWSFDYWVTITQADRRAKDAMLAAGNTELFFTEEDLARVRTEALAVYEIWKQKSPLTARIIESQMEFMRELDLID